MNETSSTSGPDRTVVVNANSLGRLWTLAIISLVLNGLIVLFLLVAIIGSHHKEKKEGFGGRDGGGEGCACDRGSRGDFHHFHRFHHFGNGGFEMKRGGGFDRGGRFGGGQGFGGNGGGFHPGWGGPQGGFGPQAGFGGQGQFQRGFGGGMGPGAGMEARDPALMTDAIVGRLTQALTLTDDEQAKIKPIVQADVTQFQKDEQTWRQDFQKRVEDAKAKIKPILTADQQKELDQMPVPGMNQTDETAGKGAPAAK